MTRISKFIVGEADRISEQRFGLSINVRGRVIEQGKNKFASFIEEGAMFKEGKLFFVYKRIAD